MSTRYGCSHRLIAGSSWAHSAYSPYTSLGFSLEVGCGDRVDECLGIRPGKGHAAFTEQPSDDCRVAVAVPDELVRAVVQEQERPVRPVHVPEAASRDVRAFQVLGPGRVKRVEPAVQQLQSADLAGSELVVDDDDEVDVAELVGVAGREGAVEVGGAERVPEALPCAVDELGKHGVELRVRRRRHAGQPHERRTTSSTGQPDRRGGDAAVQAFEQELRRLTAELVVAAARARSSAGRRARRTTGSSNATSAMSSGTRRPAARQAAIAPIASVSPDATTAVGGSASASSRVIAAAALSRRPRRVGDLDVRGIAAGAVPLGGGPEAREPLRSRREDRRPADVSDPLVPVTGEMADEELHPLIVRERDLRDAAARPRGCRSRRSGSPAPSDSGRDVASRIPLT